MNVLKAGWIGLGKMGNPMSQQLVKSGYSLTVYNRHVEKEASFAATGISTASSPAELIQRTDVIFIMVTDDQAIEDIFLSDRGLLIAGTSGKLVVNMSSVSPGISRKMADLLVKQGNSYLDAPVSGSIKQAEEAQLAIMVGGNVDAFEKAKPFLEHMGRLVLRVGETGAGNSAKLAINVLLGFYVQGLSEIILFANEKGIKTEDLMTLLANGAMANVLSKVKGEAIINANYKPTFTLKNIVKDLRLAQQEGISSPLAKTAFETFKSAESEFGEEDFVAIFKALAKT